MLGSSCISWLSKKQPTVAMSSCEAEYKAVFTATVECIWLRRLMADLGVEQDTANTIYTDSQSALAGGQVSIHKRGPPTLLSLFIYTALHRLNFSSRHVVSHSRTRYLRKLTPSHKKSALKMWAIFGSAVANGPQELCSPCSTQAVADNRKSGAQILDAFVKEVPNAHSNDSWRCGWDGLCSSQAGSVVTQVLCSNRWCILHAYKTLRDWGPFPADKVVATLVGQFVFILYDTSNRIVFVAQDSEGKVPFYWGTAADKSLAFSDTPEVLKAGCGKSFAPFPSGCYFSSNVGLKSYEHPLQKLKPVPRVDSQGQALGAAFKVDVSHKEKDVMHRVGSEANWARTI
ncbi:hypothetical protein L7F22_065750 [Adiantum nelumboides]|nr:hypothetical protein [Adiantum nelumboides]